MWRLLAQTLGPSNPGQAEPSRPTSEVNADIFFLQPEFVEGIVYGLNFFLLAWSVFYTFVLLIPFFEYRMFHGGGEMSNEKAGVKALRRAINLWFRYWLVLPSLLLYSLLRETELHWLFGLLACLTIGWKLWRETLMLAEFISGYFGWADKFTNFINKRFNIKQKKK